MRREVERFEAEAADGRRFTIIKSQIVVDNRTIDDPRSTRPGLILFHTPDEKEVKDNRDGTYDIVSLRLTVRAAYFKGKGPPALPAYADKDSRARIANVFEGEVSGE